MLSDILHITKVTQKVNSRNCMTAIQLQTDNRAKNNPSGYSDNLHRFYRSERRKK